VPNDKTTAAGVVSVINNANLGVKAQMINTGDSVSPFKIILTGNTGTANNFSLPGTTIADPLVPVANFQLPTVLLQLFHQQLLLQLTQVGQIPTLTPLITTLSIMEIMDISS
jgi:hypothetical protein